MWQEYAIIGRSVNLAAKLMIRAHRDGSFPILCDSSTYLKARAPRLECMRLRQSRLLSPRVTSASRFADGIASHCRDTQVRETVSMVPLGPLLLHGMDIPTEAFHPAMSATKPGAKAVSPSAKHRPPQPSILMGASDAHAELAHPADMVPTGYDMIPTGSRSPHGASSRTPNSLSAPYSPSSRAGLATPPLRSLAPPGARGANVLRSAEEKLASGSGSASPGSHSPVARHAVLRSAYEQLARPRSVPDQGEKLIGRRKEVRHIHEWVHTFRESAKAASYTVRGGVLVVSGEVGVGKSALLRTFCAERARRGLRTVVLKGSPNDNMTPFSMMSKLIKLLFYAHEQHREQAEEMLMLTLERLNLVHLGPLLQPMLADLNLRFQPSRKAGKMTEQAPCTFCAMHAPIVCRAAERFFRTASWRGVAWRGMAWHGMACSIQFAATVSASWPGVHGLSVTASHAPLCRP